MQKIFILSCLFLIPSFLAFAEPTSDPSSSKSENLLATGNIIFTDATKVQAESVVAAATGSMPPSFVGVSFDLLLGTEQSIQLTESSVDSNVFVEEPTTQNFYEIPFIGTAYFVIGTRLFTSFDIYGRFGITYGHITKEVSDTAFASLGLPGISVDANVRQNLFLTSILGLYAHAGIGINYNLTKFIDVLTEEDSSYSYTTTTRYSQEGKDYDETQIFANAGFGLSFRIGKNEGLSIGYTLRYYFSSIYNTDSYTLEDSSGNSSIIQYGNNQIAHGVNFEYLFFL